MAENIQIDAIYSFGVINVKDVMIRMVSVQIENPLENWALFFYMCSHFKLFCILNYSIKYKDWLCFWNPWFYYKCSELVHCPSWGKTASVRFSLCCQFLGLACLDLIPIKEKKKEKKKIDLIPDSRNWTMWFLVHSEWR